MVEVRIVERALGAVANESVRGAHGLDHLLGHRPRVVATQQSPRLPFPESEVEEPLVPAALAELGWAAPRPCGFAEDPHAAAVSRVLAEESTPCRDEARGIAPQRL